MLSDALAFGRRAIDRVARHPLFMCSFRPLFLAAALQAALGLSLWLVFLGAGAAIPAVAGGPVAWHAHELVFGFGLAAVAGFIATAVPEFTATSAFGRQIAVALAFGWLAARIAFWLSGHLGPWPAAVTNVAFAAALPALVGPRLLRDPHRRHRSFVWGLLALALAAAGYHVDALRGVDPLRWSVAASSVLACLVLIAMSRVSMRIVNDALDEVRARSDPDAPEYRARPPRRNLAIFAIALHALFEWSSPGSAVGGWIALAAAAAVLGILNDWHLGRALWNRWPLILYAVYWLLALGHAALGISALTHAFGSGVGRHLITVGAMGLSVFAVLCIAGRIHSGLALDARPWVPTAAALIVGAALARAAAGVPGMPAWLLSSAGVAWVIAWALYLVRMGPVLTGPRVDGGGGCDEARESSHSSRAPDHAHDSTT